MKAGTTTLYHDLRSQAGIFLPDKESNALLSEDPSSVLSRLFFSSAAGKITGEVCPDYTKPGLDEQAAAAAVELYRHPDRTPRLLFLARHPIDRIRSHHHFVSSQHGEANPGGMTDDIETSLQNFPELVETSRYATRLQPWIEAFGRDRLRIVLFEEYVRDRAGTLGSIAEFLGLASFDPEAIRIDQVHNASDSRPVATPGWRRVMKSPLYRKILRPLLPLGLRDRIRQGLLPSPAPRPDPPSLETREHLAGLLQPEVASLGNLMGRDTPIWNLRAGEGNR